MPWNLKTFLRKTRKWCDGCAKIAYSHENIAKAIVKHASFKGTKLNYYRCPSGLGWHLTSK